MARPRALVVAGYGINCEDETAAAWRLAGADPRTVHAGELLRGEIGLAGYEIVTLPGGFSFGDDLGSGRILANTIRFRRLDGGRLLDRLLEHRERGGHLVGICNGFQVLVKLGLLPDLSGRQAQEVTLAPNACGHFVDRWVRCRVPPAQRSPALRGMERLELPVRHGEGRLVARDAAVRQALVAGGLVALEYLGADGAPAADHPDNPAGSDLAAAALTDPTGRVLGMMPHPEAATSIFNHPDWPRRRRLSPDLPTEGDGLRMLRALVAHLDGRSP